MHENLIKGFCIVVALLVFVTIYLKYQPSASVQLSQHNSSQYASEEVAQKLQSTQLTKKIIIALRAEGYHPDSTIEYLIDSSDNQIITISLHNLEKIDNRTESKIQKIVNNIAKKNNFNLFIVDVQLTDRN
ncbi:hypothetical protein LYSIN_00930 [Lysinibacillus sphaericus]|uniref:Uncharacterized protein n=1 Tax=Lysinibacillus sphaericus TaxID=1421 RepID=A0A2S5CZH5_LYSSH|nr:hypothetical protein [Lysinibacillus sphaericus]POZ56147.1 hypothetical protein LYSIN_00930 [Lysinibacillus sphaericus]